MTGDQVFLVKCNYPNATTLRRALLYLHHGLIYEAISSGILYAPCIISTFLPLFLRLSGSLNGSPLRVSSMNFIASSRLNRNSMLESLPLLNPSFFVHSTRERVMPLTVKYTVSRGFLLYKGLIVLKSGRAMGQPDI